MKNIQCAIILLLLSHIGLNQALANESPNKEKIIEWINEKLQVYGDLSVAIRYPDGRLSNQSGNAPILSADGCTIYVKYDTDSYSDNKFRVDFTKIGTTEIVEEKGEWVELKDLNIWRKYQHPGFYIKLTASPDAGLPVLFPSQNFSPQELGELYGQSGQIKITKTSDHLMIFVRENDIAQRMMKAFDDLIKICKNKKQLY